jgi:Bacterial membrane protein YfhO
VPAPATGTRPPRARDRSVACALGILTAFWIALFWPQLVSHHVFFAGDATLFRRFSEFSRQRWLAEHARTFWNPYVFLGVPATASLADMRPQYLPDAWLNVWEAMWRLPGMPPLAIPLAAHLLGTLATALLARALWRAGTLAMLWAGIAWALAPGMIVPFTFGHDAQFIAASLLPVLLLCAHGLFAATDEIRAAWAALALGTTLGLQILGGHPQIIIASVGLLAAFMLERAIRFERARRLCTAGLAVLLGIALGAAVWWPALLYGRDTIRGGVAGVNALEVASFSHAWRDLVTLFWPRAVGWGGATYWGGLRKTDFPQAAGTLVCLLALFARPRAGDRRVFVLLWAAFACALLLSLGMHLGGVDRLLRAGVPLYSNFRVAVTWLVIAQPALALLSALGVERVVAPSRTAARLGRIELAGLAATGLAAALGIALVVSPLGDHLAAFARSLRPSLGVDAARSAIFGAGVDLAWRAMLPLGLGVLWWMRGRAAGQGAVTLAALALLALDLGAVDAPFLAANSGPGARLAAAPPPQIALAAAADPLERAMPLDVALTNTNDWIRWRAHSVAGVHGAIDRDWNTLMGAGLATHYEALCACAVGYTVLPADALSQPGLWTRIGDGGRGTSVVRLTRALPRAYCVPRVDAPGRRTDVLAALMSDAFRAHDAALADEAAVAGAYPGSRGCTLSWIEDAPDHLCIATQARAAAFLVIADPLLPGWSARVDGRGWPVHRVDYMLRGVQLPAGHHVLEMTYVPPGWREALPVTRAAAGAVPVLALVLGLAGRAARPRRTRPGPPELQRSAA